MMGILEGKSPLAQFMLNSRNKTGAEDTEVCINHSAVPGYIGKSQSPASYGIGDLSFMDGEGFLHIICRKKNVLSTSLRRNISPECPESEPLPQSERAQCLVVEDGAAFPEALLIRIAKQRNAVTLP